MVLVSRNLLSVDSGVCTRASNVSTRLGPNLPAEHTPHGSSGQAAGDIKGTGSSFSTAVLISKRPIAGR